MTRKLLFQRQMACIALVAMLLLTLLPSIGRLMSQSLEQPLQGADSYALPAKGNPEPLLGAMCTSRGLAYDAGLAALEAASFGLTSEEEERPPPVPHRHADCDYCALSASAVTPAALFVPVPALRAAGMPSVRLSRTSTWVYPLGLGSRGPPLKA
jgi:hypothetical protein